MNLATIIIDMQNAFMIPISEDRKNKLINSQISMIKYSFENNIPVFNVLYSGVGPFWDVFDIKDTCVSKIRKTLDNYSNTDLLQDDHIKNSDNLFSEDDSSSKKILQKLNSKNIDTLYLMGVNSDSCVYKSALDASQHFDVHVSDDTMTSPDFFLEFYNTKESRMNRFFESYTPFLGNTISPKTENLKYYDSYLDFIDFFQKNKYKLINNDNLNKLISKDNLISETLNSVVSKFSRGV